MNKENKRICKIPYSKVVGKKPTHIVSISGFIDPYPDNIEELEEYRKGNVKVNGLGT